MALRVASLSDVHYVLGGYDYDFVSELDSRFECPICLLCQRDPHQTGCGHRFCYSCICTWLSEGKTCPKDNASLGEGDLFPDTMAHREIMQLFVRCPVERCAAVVHLADVEAHAVACRKTRHGDGAAADSSANSASFVALSDPVCPSCGETLAADVRHKSGDGHQAIVCPNALTACPFTSAGCTDRVMRKDMQKHLDLQLQHHIQLISDKVMKLQQSQSLSALSLSECEDATESEGATAHGLALASEDDGGMRRWPAHLDQLRLSGSNAQSTQKLLKDLFQRVVQLEQRNRQLELNNERLQQRLAAAQRETLSRCSGGEIVWRIEGFREVFAKLRASHKENLYSPSFYTSPYGYKVCLRCNVNFCNGEEQLGVFVHMMRGENDAFVEWPFQGSFVVTILNQQHDRLLKSDFSMKMDSCGNLDAFKRPDAEMNPIGFGLRDFIRVNGLFTGGFVESGTLFIRAMAISLE